jgi:hypothetical protein
MLIMFSRVKQKKQNEQNLHMLVHLTSSLFGFVHSFGLLKKGKRMLITFFQSKNNKKNE